MIHTARFLFATLLLLLAPPLVSVSYGQSDFETGLDVFPNLKLDGLGSESDEPATFSADYSVVDGAVGQLTVSVTLAPGWHIYSLTQADGGPTPTTLRVSESSGAKMISEFSPDSPPLKSVNKAWPDLTIEEHSDKVVWTAKIKLPEASPGPIDVAIKALVCKTDGACVPIDKTLVANAAKPSIGQVMAGGAASTTSPGESPVPPKDVIPPSEPQIFRDGDYVVQWTIKMEPAKVEPGQQAKLVFTAKPDAGYHVYAAATDDSESSTNFVFTEKAGLKIGKPRASSRPISESVLPGLPPVEYHEAAVTWSIPVLIPAEATPGVKKLQGAIGYQACTDRSCLPPKAFRFTVAMTVGDVKGTTVNGDNVTFVSAPYAQTLDAAAETRWVDDFAVVDEGSKADVSGDAEDAKTNGASGPMTQKSTDEQTKLAAGADAIDEVPAVTEASGFPLPAILAMAICGGLILNLMPCVLPVVGLKVMAFAEQAGEQRARVLMLNLWYTLGILVVFWALAAVAILFSFSWGEQFTYFSFRFGVTLLVFAMALSFLGVWEIPIPGFVGGTSTQKLQRREGAAGAFFKGIFTTLLATPCSGPLLGTVFAFTLGKSAVVTTLIFSAVGFGMALPYLLIALYPGLIMFFPKPGVWMDTFKQLLAFLLLGTVVYLFGGFSDDDRMPVFASLIGVWFGCWIIGQVPAWSRLDRRIASWLGGVASATLICVLAFRFLAPGPAVLPWEPYSEARLQQLQREGRTVLIDFTAKWCVNCIVNYNVAINTPKTSQLVAELDAVPMLADWTDHNEEIKNKLVELNSNSIPVLAIYPGAQPSSPIVLRDLISQGDVLEALRKAGSTTAIHAAPAAKASMGVSQVSNRESSVLVPAP